jgi:hypothetical protein
MSDYNELAQAIKKGQAQLARWRSVSPMKRAVPPAIPGPKPTAEDIEAIKAQQERNRKEKCESAS